MPDATIGFTLLTIAATATGTMIVSGIGAYFNHWLSTNKDRRLKQEELERHARYVAIRTVCQLDSFVLNCCDLVFDEGTFDQHGENTPDVAHPALGFAEDLDWRSIEPELMYRILSFPNEIAGSLRAIGEVSDHVAGPPDYTEYFWERTKQFGSLGLRALRLASDIRDHYRIPQQLPDELNAKELLARRVEKINTLEAEAEIRRAEHQKRMSTTQTEANGQ